MKWVRWPVALAAAGSLCAGAALAAREGVHSANVLLVLAGVLIGAWLVMEGNNDDSD